MKRYLLVLLMTFGITCNLVAKELSVAFPQFLPPWTLQERHAGITVDIVRESLKLAGHTLKPEYISLKDLNTSIDSSLDGHAQVESQEIEGHYSEKIMIFQTKLVSLAERKIQVKTLADLKPWRVLAFQNANFLFGEEFQKFTKDNSNYSEISNQEEQVVQLYNGDVDLILVDKNIFLYFRRITSVVDTSPRYFFHFIKGLTIASPAYAVFRDEQIKDAFNSGLQQLKDNGNYYKIYSKYVR